jgi:hypothetical protein
MSIRLRFAEIRVYRAAINKFRNFVEFRARHSGQVKEWLHDGRPERALRQRKQGPH